MLYCLNIFWYCFSYLTLAIKLQCALNIILIENYGLPTQMSPLKSTSFGDLLFYKGQNTEKLIIP